MEYKTNAPKGRDLLNERKPGWFRDMDLTRFHISYPWDCVLGQVYGGYRKGLQELFGALVPSGKPWEYGFLGEDDAEDVLLNSEWTAIIAELQAEDARTAHGEGFGGQDITYEREQ